MDIHNYPIDYAVAVTDERVSRLMHERNLRHGRPIPESMPAGRAHGGWMLRLVLAEPLIVGCAGFVLGWLVAQRA